MADHHPGRQTTREYPELRRDVRRLAVLLFVAAAGLAVATLLRPAGGYRAALPLVRAVVVGSGGAILLLLVLAVLTVAVRRRPQLSTRSVCQMAGSVPVVSLAAVVAAIALVAISAWPAGDRKSSSGVSQAAFSRWQGEIVPLAVTFGHLLRTLAAADHEPQSGRLRDALQSQHALQRLGSQTQVVSIRYRRTPELHRLTSLLEQAVRHADAAAAQLAVRGSAAASPTPSATRTVRRRAEAELTAAALSAQAFTVQANGLGGRLAATSPPGG